MYFLAGTFSLKEKEDRDFILEPFRKKFIKDIFFSKIKNCIIFSYIDKAYSSIYKLKVIEEDNFVIGFEGYISNWRDKKIIKKDKRICQFKKIIELYKKDGSQGLSQLKGSFALTLYDKKRKKIFLIRDKHGKKPLYYTRIGDKVSFNTSFAQLLKLPGVKKEIDYNRIFCLYYLNGMTLGEETEFRDVKNVKPGHVLEISEEGMKLNKLKYVDHFKIKQMRDGEIFTHLDSISKNEIEKYFSSTKSMNLLFSGGIDSGMIFLSALKYKLPINTYTMEYSEGGRAKEEDAEQARNTAKDFKSNYYHKTLSSNDFISMIERIVGNYERPASLITLSTAIFLDWVSEFQDEVFSGEGIEEQFGFFPNPAFRFALYADKMLQATSKEDYLKIYPILEKQYFNIFTKFPHHSEDFNERTKSIFSKNFSKNFSCKKLEATFKDCWDNTNDVSVGFNPQKNYTSILNKVFELQTKNCLIPNKVNLYDSLSKIYSIDFITPYIDSDFIDTSLKVPPLLKATGESYLEMKKIFREVVNSNNKYNLNFLKKKAGANFPLPDWMIKKNFEKYIRSVLSEGRIKRVGVFNFKYINLMVDRYYSDITLVRHPSNPRMMKQEYDYSYDLLKIMGIQLWFEKFFK